MSWNKRRMRLASFIAGGRPRFGALVDHETLLDLREFANLTGQSEMIGQGMREFLSLGDSARLIAERLLEEARRNARAGRPPDGCLFSCQAVKWLPPVPNPSKIVAIGQNYKDHCLEQNLPFPTYPTVFAKFPSSLIGHLDDIVYPAETNSLDYEVELCLFIGKTAKDVSEPRWAEFVAGYTVINDVTARDIQKGEQQWVRGKSFDTFAPCGPFLVTDDDVADPGNLDLWLKVNGEMRQQSNTNQLVFGVPELVARLSRSFTLFPGDLVLTGTPGGVGIYRNPPALLSRGDLVELSVSDFGVLRNRVV